MIFETCNTLKDAIIREWNYMEIDDVNSIRDYLLQHVLNHPNTPVFVREKILQVKLESSFNLNHYLCFEAERFHSTMYFNNEKLRFIFYARNSVS